MQIWGMRNGGGLGLKLAVTAFAVEMSMSAAKLYVSDCAMSTKWAENAALRTERGARLASTGHLRYHSHRGAAWGAGNTD